MLTNYLFLSIPFVSMNRNGRRLECGMQNADCVWNAHIALVKSLKFIISTLSNREIDESEIQEARIGNVNMSGENIQGNRGSKTVFDE